MDIADILHYLAVLRDIAGVIETDDPELVQSLSGITGTVQQHITTISASSSAAPSENNVASALSAVTAAAPSIAGLLSKL